jgi:hypothetical protein
MRCADVVVAGLRKGDGIRLTLFQYTGIPVAYFALFKRCGCVRDVSWLCPQKYQTLTNRACIRNRAFFTSRRTVRPYPLDDPSGSHPNPLTVADQRHKSSIEDTVRYPEAYGRWVSVRGPFSHLRYFLLIASSAGETGSGVGLICINAGSTVLNIGSARPG